MWILIIDIMEIIFFDPKPSKKKFKIQGKIPSIFKVLKIGKYFFLKKIIIQNPQCFEEIYNGAGFR